MYKLSDGSVASKILWAAKESDNYDPKFVQKKTGYERRYVEKVLFGNAKK